MKNNAYIYYNYYADYQQLHEEMKTANETVSSNNSAELKGEISEIAAQVDSCSLDAWDDSVGDSYLACVFGVSNNLEIIESSIDGTFRESEMRYVVIKGLLDTLKIADSDYEAKYLEKPNPEDDKYWELVPDVITNEGEQTYIRRKKEKKYEEDLLEWKSDMKEIYELINGDNGYIPQIEENLQALIACDNALINIGNTPLYSFSSIIGNGSYISLPTNFRKNYFTEKYSNKGNPYTITTNQNDWASVSIQGEIGVDKNLGTSGCGIMTADICISCSLSAAYGTDIYLDPVEFTDELYATSSSSKSKDEYLKETFFTDDYDFSWSSTAFDAITKTFPDGAIIKVSARPPVFTKESFHNILDAGGVAQVSLKGIGHITSVRGYGSTSDSVSMFDSGIPSQTETTVGAYDIKSRSSDGFGDVGGKDGAIYVPNQNLKINSETGVIEGIDATGVDVQSISICGKTYSAHTDNDHIVVDNVAELATDIGSTIL